MPYYEIISVYKNDNKFQHYFISRVRRSVKEHTCCHMTVESRSTNLMAIVFDLYTD
jgi:hypothetical protein